MMWALPLESPPLLLVSDRLQIDLHTRLQFGRTRL